MLLFSPYYFLCFFDFFAIFSILFYLSATSMEKGAWGENPDVLWDALYSFTQTISLKSPHTVGENRMSWPHIWIMELHGNNAEVNSWQGLLKRHFHMHPYFFFGCNWQIWSWRINWTWRWRLPNIKPNPWLISY